MTRAKPAPTSADPSAQSATAGTNPERLDGEAIVSAEGSGTAEITRHPGNKPAMQEAGMEAAVEAGNWEAALSAVERNAGAPGPDGMRTEELREHLAKHGAGIRAKLLKGSYQPGAARRKEIPKPNGGIRPLSIPNVLDRFVQQMLLQVMQPWFEPHFSEVSHGFDSAALRPSGAPSSHLSPFGRLDPDAARMEPSRPPRGRHGKGGSGWWTWTSPRSLTV